MEESALCRVDRLAPAVKVHSDARALDADDFSRVPRVALVARKDLLAFEPGHACVCACVFVCVCVLRESEMRCACVVERVSLATLADCVNSAVGPERDAHPPFHSSTTKYGALAQSVNFNFEGLS